MYTMNRCKPHFSPVRRLCAGALLAGLACSGLMQPLHRVRRLAGRVEFDHLALHRPANERPHDNPAAGREIGGLGVVEDLAGLLVVVPETGGADDDLQFGEAAVYVGDVKETSAGASVSRPRWRAGTWSSRTYGGAG